MGMKTKMEIKLSLIIPAYNEEKIIADNLEKVSRFLKAKEYGWEIIVVNDGSKDSTAEIVERLSEKDKRIRIINLGVNQGKGVAIRAGVLGAKGEYILFSDADLSVPINFVDSFLVTLGEGADVAIGSRRVVRSNIIKHQKLLRESLGRAFTMLSKITTFTNISDFTCGFKGFERDAAIAIFSRTLINRWVYDTEILFLAKKLKYKIVEIPVDWVNRGDSRVKLMKVIIPSFIDLFRIRMYDLLGKYA